MHAPAPAPAPAPAALAAATRSDDRPADRIGWLDVARGIGIVLVVLGHALGGLIDSPLGLGQDGFRRTFFAIYTFHMPLFLLLSGLLVPRRLEKGTGAFARSLLPTIVWPYFLWSALQYSLIYALGSAVNNPVDAYWPSILALPWKTVSQFWFLHALFLMHLMAIALLPRLGREGLVLTALALKALVLIAPLPVVAKLAFVHFLFYAIGAWLGPAGVERLVIDRPAWVRLAVLPLLAVLAIGATLAAVPDYGVDLPLLAASSPQISNLAWRFPATAAAVCGVFALLGLASLARGPLAGGLAALGRLTMPIFVLHVMFIAGTRIVLIRFVHLGDPAAMLPLLVAVGLVGPVVVALAVRRLGFQRWLGF